MMNWGEIEQKKQKHWKRRRRRLFGPMVAVDLGHQTAILLFILCLFEFADNVVGMAQNCTKRREEGRSTLLMGESKLECPSLRAFSQFKFDANSTNQIGNFELNCGGEEMMENETMNALGQIQREFPALRQISLHNCSIQFVHQFAASKLLPSNLELHQCAKSTPSLWAGFDEAKCDAIGVLWLTRELIRQGFDIKLFIPNSYMAGPFADNVSENFILEELRDLGLLTIIYDHCHDDILMLEYAKITGGFIISNDKYRDHEMDFKTRDHDAVKIIRERVVRFHFQKLNFEDKMVRKWLGRGGQELMSSPKANSYLGIECVLKPPSMNAMYSWDQRGDETHGIVFHQRMLRSQRTAEKCLERLNCICEFMRLRFCEIKFIKPELPDWLEPEHQLIKFGTFWSKFTRWQREGRLRRKEQKKMCDFYGYQGEAEKEENWTNSQRNNRRGGGESNSSATPPKSRIMAYNGVDDDSSRRDIWKEE